MCVGGNATVDLLLSGVTTEGGVNEHVKMCLGPAMAVLQKQIRWQEICRRGLQVDTDAVKPYPKVDSTGKD
jgi:hypothetical protein